MSNYDIVRDACVRANPEILEIKRKACYGHANDHEDSMYKYFKKFEVARAIRLSDVLLAIKSVRLPYALLIDQEGGFSEVRADGRIRMHSVLKAQWYFAHDSLEWHRDNAPEVIDWLAELLTKQDSV